MTDHPYPRRILLAVTGLTPQALPAMESEAKAGSPR